MDLTFAIIIGIIFAIVLTIINILTQKYYSNKMKKSENNMVKKIIKALEKMEWENGGEKQ